MINDIMSIPEYGIFIPSYFLNVNDPVISLSSFIYPNRPQTSTIIILILTAFYKTSLISLRLRQGGRYTASPKPQTAVTSHHNLLWFSGPGVWGGFPPQTNPGAVKTRRKVFTYCGTSQPVYCCWCIQKHRHLRS